MRLGSETAYRKAQEGWDALLREKGAGEVDFARELFALADVFASAPALVAALEDAARSAHDRAALAQAVVKSKTSGEVEDLTAGLVRERWSESGDLVRAVEKLGVQTLLSGAEREGQLSEVESELYSLRNLLGRERELRTTLSDTRYSLSARKQLMASLLTTLSTYTEELFERALSKTGETSLRSTLADYIEAVGERSEHLVASVTAAIPLTREQEERLAGVLSRQFAADVQIHTTVDTSVIGGVKVLIGSHVIDGTLASRLQEVKEVFRNGR
ncbi:MAG: F0F1 ATP synthase subunit delta [Actinomycetaceae bacterium]|nr:F0F1 ATP synthase subunit delta [Actinomycetaceae bacterium]MDY5272952.1 F0F1 ATP synthase subunit delta [Arcanobacterium sp.]